MTKVRIYRVRATNVSSAPARLIRAANVAQARNHAARNHFDVAVATQDDLVLLIKAGTLIEEPGTEPVEPESDAPQLKVA
jgi:hypothetical protein